MSNSDTAVFVFSFLFAAMLMIYLFGLYGVAGVLLFMFCAVGYAASGNSNPSAFRNMINGFQFGIRLFVLLVLLAIVGGFFHSC
ncbi:hypothetical protein [uncultured Victivallis sp.]|uniref:hypothetical protein n=1 Tax=uncultured Victivallis sp. TaxID=354118 RepID=UPI00258F0D86|nr:hypothetical protein [uncultured Victivallis sp.]